jgi:hypothetical protein
VAEALGIADVLDVDERPCLEVVHADDPVSTGEQLIAEMGPQEAGAAGDKTRWHGPDDIGSDAQI